MVVLN